MANSILRRYLDLGLFRIGDDDSRFHVFEKAADDLASEFTKSPADVISAALVAVDPAIPEVDPMVERAEAAVKAHWSTFSNKYDQRPVGLLRSVLLGALNQAAQGSPGIGAAVWLAGANLACRVDLGSERPIVDAMLRALGDATEEEGVKDSDAGDWTIPELGIKWQAPKKTKIDKEKLELGIADAAGPNYKGKALQDANPSWPNNPQPWSNEFASRAADTIANSLERVTAPLVDQSSELASRIEEKVNEFAAGMKASLTRWAESTVRESIRRTSILWLKESLYSPSLKTSYREMAPPELVMAMALDLATLCRLPAPQSVEWLLREMVLAAIPKNPEIAVGELLLTAKASERLGGVLQAAPVPNRPLRVSLCTALSFARHTALTHEDLPAWLGVSGSLKVPAAALSAWLFRDSQAIALVSKGEKQ